MARAVQTASSPIIHLQLDGDNNTYCGVRPVKNVTTIIRRIHMCSNCYGKDRGKEKWSANLLGVEKIV